MADRHGIEPSGPSRGRSASPAAATTTAACTSARPTRSRPTPRTWPSSSPTSARRARGGGQLRRQRLMGHSVYHIAYSYYKDRFLRGRRQADDPRRAVQEAAGQSARAAGAGRAWDSGSAVWPRGIVRGRRHATGQRVGTDAGQGFLRAVLDGRAARLGLAADGRAADVPHRLPDQPRAGIQLPAAVRRVAAARAGSWRACKPSRPWGRSP